MKLGSQRLLLVRPRFLSMTRSEPLTRAHASTEGVTHYIAQSAMGLLIERELEFLQGKLESPEKPFVCDHGVGPRFLIKSRSSKPMMDKADTFIIGGAMAYTFRKAQGYKVGKSLVENDCLELALEILELAKTRGINFHLPADTRITQEFSPDAETKVTAVYGEGGEIPDDWEGIDIGDQAIGDFLPDRSQCQDGSLERPHGVCLRWTILLQAPRLSPRR